MEPVEWAGIIFTAFWLYACNCAGIGGAGTLVPLIRMWFRFDVKDSVGLSNATIVVAAGMRYLINLRNPHPLKFDTFNKQAGTMVDYNLTVVMLPMLIMGCAIGVMVSMLLPPPVITSILSLALLYVMRMTAMRL